MSDKISIFNTPNITTESWTIQGAVVQWGTGNSATSAIPMILDGIDIAYAVPAREITPINGNDTGSVTRVVIKGTPTGTLQVNTIFSPSMANFKEFLKAVTRSCKGPSDQVLLTLRPFGRLECTNSELAQGKNMTFYLHDLDMVGMRVSITNQNGMAIVTMPLNFTFTNFELE